MIAGVNPELEVPNTATLLKYPTSEALLGLNENSTSFPVKLLHKADDVSWSPAN